MEITEFFQDIQDVYSSLTNLHICITDCEGSQITKQSHDPSIFDLITDQENSKTMFRNIIQNYPKVNEPILYELLPGINIIIYPIFSKEEIEFFIFAGCIIESSAKPSVHSYLNKLWRNPKKLNFIFPLIKEFTQNELRDQMKKLKRMSEILSNRVLTQKLMLQLNAQNERQDEIFKLVSEDKFAIYDLLKWFQEKNPNIDFIGYARRMSPLHFEVKECIPSDNSLKGTAFLMGEGMLGQAAATNTGDFWNEVDWDPRNVFFHKKGIFPKSVFCFPIVLNQEPVGMFFGGSTNLDHLKKEMSLEVKFAASLLAIIENKTYWQAKTMFNQMKSSVLNDILHSMVSFKDIKSVQTFLLDMSVSLTLTPFVSVVLLPQSKDSIDMASRGLAEEKMKEYYNDMTDRYVNKNVLEPNNREPITHLTKWGSKVLELPIYYHKNFYGYLCIGLSDDMDENQLSLLSILANAGGIAMYMLNFTNKEAVEAATIDSIVKLLEFNNPEHLIKAGKARQIITGFGAYLEDPKINIGALILCCFLIIDDEQFLNGIKNQSVVMDILREYRLVAENQADLSNTSMNVQILVLVWSFINQKEDIDSLSKLKGINRELLLNFTYYISRSSVTKIEKPANHDSYTDKESLINHNPNLTKREIEVLKLVLEGKNNHEIAAHLFISGHTVKNHMTHIFNKLSVKDRTQVIAKIYRMGFKPKNVS